MENRDIFVSEDSWGRPRSSSPSVRVALRGEREKGGGGGGKAFSSLKTGKGGVSACFTSLHLYSEKRRGEKRMIFESESGKPGVFGYACRGRGIKVFYLVREREPLERKKGKNSLFAAGG